MQLETFSMTFETRAYQTESPLGEDDPTEIIITTFKIHRHDKKISIKTFTLQQSHIGDRYWNSYLEFELDNWKILEEIHDIAQRKEKNEIGNSSAQFEVKGGRAHDEKNNFKLNQLYSVKIDVTDRFMKFSGTGENSFISIPPIIPYYSREINGGTQDTNNLSDFTDFLGNSYHELVDTSNGGEFWRFSATVFDEQLTDRVLPKYEKGEYREAADLALRILDERVKNLASDSVEAKHGTKLMKEAFRSDGGPLSFGGDNSEKTGIMFLYAGAMQGLRNPLTHRTTPDDSQNHYLDNLDQSLAHDIISFTNFLLRLLKDNTKSR